MNKFVNFFLLCTVLAGILAGGIYAVYTQALHWPVTFGMIGAIVYFYLLTLVVHALLVKAGNKNPKRFVSSFMGILSLKMMVSLAILVVYILINRDYVMGFGVAFLVSYLAFTALEIVTLLKVLRAQEVQE